jgi:hypothetical protein
MHTPWRLLVRGEVIGPAIREDIGRRRDGLLAGRLGVRVDDGCRGRVRVWCDGEVRGRVESVGGRWLDDLDGRLRLRRKLLVLHLHWDLQARAQRRRLVEALWGGRGLLLRRQHRRGGRRCEHRLGDEALKRGRVESTGPKELVHVRELAQFREVETAHVAVEAGRQGGGEHGAGVSEEVEELGLLLGLRQRRWSSGARRGRGCVRRGVEGSG